MKEDKKEKLAAWAFLVGAVAIVVVTAAAVVRLVGIAADVMERRDHEYEEVDKAYVDCMRSDACSYDELQELREQRRELKTFGREVANTLVMALGFAFGGGFLAVRSLDKFWQHRKAAGGM